jgi:hypothetical protein
MPAPYPAYPGSAGAVDPRARTAGILLLVCALALLVGLASRSWFTARGGSLGVLGIEECRGAVCHSVSWLDAKRVPGEIQVFSVMALIGGFVGIGFLIQAGVVLLMNNPRKVIMQGLNISLGIAAFGIVSFFFRFSVGDYSRGVSMSWAGLLAVASVIGAAIILPVMVRPLRAAAAPPMPPAPFMPPPMPPVA